MIEILTNAYVVSTLIFSTFLLILLIRIMSYIEKTSINEYDDLIIIRAALHNYKDINEDKLIKLQNKQVEGNYKTVNNITKDIKDLENIIESIYELLDKIKE